MTDNEIIKALECCIKNTCSECPFYKNWITHRCGELRNLVLDLINRLEAEIERLQTKNEELGKAISKAYELNKFLEATRKLVREEAIKEFAERVKMETNCGGEIYAEDIDNLVKEMTESVNYGSSKTEVSENEYQNLP